MKRYGTTTFVLIVLATFAHADLNEVDAVKVGMPEDVAALVDRIVGCNHWSGEPPFDKDRTNEIKHVLSELKCGEIGSDIESMRAKYWARPNVDRALDTAVGISH